jgi:hypothetical protein
MGMRSTESTEDAEDTEGKGKGEKIGRARLRIFSKVPLCALCVLCVLCA